MFGSWTKNVVLWRIFFKLFDLKNLLMNNDVDFLSLSVKSTSIILLFRLKQRKWILLNALLSSVFMFSYIVFLSVHTAAHELGPINGILEKIHFKVSAIIKNGALF